MIQAVDSLAMASSGRDTALHTATSQPRQTVMQTDPVGQKQTTTTQPKATVAEKNIAKTDTTATTTLSLAPETTQADTTQVGTDSLNFWQQMFVPLTGKPKHHATQTPPGVEGDPIPYTAFNDNLVSGLLLACFIVTIVILSAIKHFLRHQLSHFFRVQRGRTTEMNETSTEIKLQFFLALQTSLLIAILALLYIREAGMQLPFNSNQQVIITLTAIAAAYYLLKIILYTVVDTIFFKPQQHSEWLKNFLLLVAMEGIALFPIILMKAYTSITNQAVIIYIMATLGVIKLLTIYKINSIFFRQPTAILQLFLYLCTLEIVPMALVWGFLQNSTHYLTI